MGLAFQEEARVGMQKVYVKLNKDIIHIEY